MESIKCQECGLVSWADRETISCKRCGGPLWGKRSYSLGEPTDVSGDGFKFSGMIKFVTIVLGVAMLSLLICRVFSLTESTFGKMMAVMFIVVGFVLIVFMKIWFLKEVFSESVGWGLASLFVPFGALIALVKFWDKTRRPFVAHLISTGIIFAGALAGGLL